MRLNFFIKSLNRDIIYKKRSNPYHKVITHLKLYSETWFLTTFFYLISVIAIFT